MPSRLDQGEQGHPMFEFCFLVRGEASIDFDAGILIFAKGMEFQKLPLDTNFGVPA